MGLRTRNKRKQGLSLIEVMIALTILGFGLLLASLGQLSAIKRARDSRAQAAAMYLAQQQIEIFQSMSGTDVIAVKSNGSYPNDPDNPIDPDPGDDDDTTFVRRYTITEDTPIIGIIEIVVEVDYRNSIGATNTTTLRSLKAEL